MRALKYMVFIVMVLLGGSLSAGEINWNDKKLDWLNYENGLEQLKSKKQIGIIVLYADWCSTCKEYSKIFKKGKWYLLLKG